MPDNRISPGLVTATGGRLLTRLRDQADMNRAAIERIRAVPPMKKPAVLTGRAFDSVTGFWNYSWTEQGYDERGLRYTKPGGMTGTTTWNPAVAYGDGHLPTTFPQEVTIRRRGLSSSRGVVWEFPWFCGCTAGTGSGSGGVTNACCPGIQIPLDLYATILAPGCSCFDGQTFAMTFGGSGQWSGGLTNVCTDGSTAQPYVTNTARLECVLGGWVLTWLETFSSLGGGTYACSFGSIASQSTTCAPFSFVGNGTFGNLHGTCPCNGIAYQLIITG